MCICIKSAFILRERLFNTEERIFTVQFIQAIRFGPSPALKPSQLRDGTAPKPLFGPEAASCVLSILFPDQRLSVEVWRNEHTCGGVPPRRANSFASTSWYTQRTARSGRCFAQCCSLLFAKFRQSFNTFLKPDDLHSQCQIQVLTF